MKSVPGLVIRVPRAIEVMVRGGDRAGAERALAGAADVARPVARALVGLWAVQDAAREARSVERALACTGSCIDDQLPLFADLGPLGGVGHGG